MKGLSIIKVLLEGKISKFRMCHGYIQITFVHIGMNIVCIYKKSN